MGYVVSTVQIGVHHEAKDGLGSFIALAHLTGFKHASIVDQHLYRIKILGNLSGKSLSLSQIGHQADKALMGIAAAQFGLKSLDITGCAGAKQDIEPSLGKGFDKGAANAFGGSGNYTIGHIIKGCKG